MKGEPDKHKAQQIANWLGSGSINIFGLPYSGKDTQGKMLAELLNAPLVGSGDILRKSNDLPDEARKTIDQGFLAPTQAFLDIVSPYLARAEFNDKPLILSSIGRWHGEEEAIMRAAAEAGHPIKAVVFLSLDEAQIQKRWQVAQQTHARGQRADDEATKIANRIDEFNTKTLPVIEYYRQKGLLIVLDGNQASELVGQQIIDRLVQLAT